LIRAVAYRVLPVPSDLIVVRHSHILNCKTELLRHRSRQSQHRHSLGAGSI
jgi:hypothetical protein